MLALRSETDKVHMFQEKYKKLTDEQMCFFTCVGQSVVYMRWAANPYKKNFWHIYIELYIPINPINPMNPKKVSLLKHKNTRNRKTRE